MLRCCAPLVLGIFGLLLSPLAWAERSQSTHSTLTVLVQLYPPYTDYHQTQVQGDAFAQLERVLARAGIDYQVDVLPWKRAYARAQQEANILLLPIERNRWDDDQFMAWYGPIVPPFERFLYRNSLRGQMTVNTLSDARERYIGVMRGSAMNTRLEALDFSNLILTDSHLSLAKLLLASRVDLISANDGTIQSVAQSLGVAASHFEKVHRLPDDDYTGLFMALSHGSDAQLAQRIQFAWLSLE